MPVSPLTLEDDPPDADDEQRAAGHPGEQEDDHDVRGDEVGEVPVEVPVICARHIRVKRPPGLRDRSML